MSNKEDMSIYRDLSYELTEIMINDAKEIVSGLAIATPKKDGIATGNWHVTINKISNKFLDRVDLSGAQVSSEEFANIDKAKNMLYPIIYIQNNAPHIGPLNNGHSPQAGKHFVETVIRAKIT